MDIWSIPGPGAAVRARDLADPDGHLVDPGAGRRRPGLGAVEPAPDSLEGVAGARLAFLHLRRQPAEGGLQGPEHALITIRPGGRGGCGGRSRRRLFKPSKAGANGRLQGGDRLSCPGLRTVKPVGQPVKDIRQPAEFGLRAIKRILGARGNHGRGRMTHRPPTG